MITCSSEWKGMGEKERGRRIQKGRVREKEKENMPESRWGNFPVG